MKKALFILLSFINISLAFAQAPPLINYQAVVRDANGNLITSGTISLGISIHDAIIGGNQLYFETHNNVSPTNGLVNVHIGGGTVILGNFSTINWASGSKYVQIYVNNNPVGDRTQFVSNVYALYANQAGNANTANSAITAATANSANTANTANFATKADTANIAKKLYQTYTGPTSFLVTSATSPNNPVTVSYVNSYYCSENEHRYIVFSAPTPIDFIQAQEVARKAKGHLLTITSAEENNWLITNVFNTNMGNIALGVTDAPAEGFWFWVTGEFSVTNNDNAYGYWAPGEPSNSGSGEDFGRVITSNSYKWGDINNLPPAYSTVIVEYSNTIRP